MEAAKIIRTLVLNLSLFLPNLSAAFPCHPSMCKRKGAIHGHGYTRFADVERHCQSVLSSAAELEPDPYLEDNLMYQLSFANGDWSQDAGGQAPLLPFHGSYADDPAVPGPGLLGLEAVPLASFSLRHMDTAQQRGARTAVNASGVLTLTIARNSSCGGSQSQMEMDLCPSPEFELRPGIARLKVLFQGVYTETMSSASGDGGERVLCMVGDAVLPVRASNSTDPWDWAKNRGSNLEPPPVVSDGNILLVLRYPKTPTLTTRAVHGEMTSTKAKSDGAYFDTVRMVSSQLSGGYDSGYQFRPEDAELDVDPPPFDEGDTMAMEQEHHRHNRGASSCDTFFQSIPSNLGMEVVRNWNCTGTDDFCSRLGPFVSSSSTRPATSAMENTAFTRSGAIVVTGLRCTAMGRGIGGAAAARVAAVFRYAPPWEHPPMAATRTGLSGMTLSAEGVWIPSTGRAHMLGCLGVGKGAACHYRVTLSVQTTMSMTRRGILAGEITAMDGRSHPPLLFQQRADGRTVAYVASRRMSYMYTKVDRALELLRLGASEPPGFRDGFVGKSLLRYPSVAGADKDDETAVSLSRLADELDVDYQGIVKPPFLPEWMEGSFFELQMLSIGTLVGRRYSPQIQRRSSMWIELLKRVHGGEKQQILNVSAEFTAYRKCLGQILVMSLEGVYNPEDGRMYLIGCRTVHAPRRVLPTSRDLEDGMDCSVEVTVEYLPTIARWLKITWPVKVVVASTRDDDDPLYFNRTELHMWLVRYRQMGLEGVTRMIMKGFLSAMALLATIWAATRNSP